MTDTAPKPGGFRSVPGDVRVRSESWPERIRAIIRDHADNGRLPASGKLPSERWLTQYLGAARMTVRKALWQLESEGAIYRFDRSGWYLAQPRFRYDPTRDVSFTETAAAQGRVPGARVLAVARRRAPEDIAAELGIATGTGLVVIERLRLLDDRPVFIEVSHVIASRCPGLAKLAGTEISLAAIYARHFAITLRRRRIRMHPTALMRPYARELRLAEGTPGLYLCRLTDDSTGRPLSLDYEYWRHDALEIEIRVP
jgi:DNA-binding GntR family transcriptional regulator